MRVFYISFCLLSAFLCADAQIVPAPGAQLNYNQVMLEHPVLRGVDGYIIQLIDLSVDSTFSHPVELRDSFPATMVSQLKFGKNYKWRFAAITHGKILAWNGPYAFSVQADPFLTGKNTRLRIVTNDSSKTAGGLVAVDVMHSIFDRKGNLVWFFPDWLNGPRKGAGTDDLFMTKAGTLTSLGGQEGNEIDLNGKILYETPHKEPVIKALAPMGGFFHHDFKRLSNGHYMVIAMDLEWKKLPSEYDINRVMALTDTSRHHWGTNTRGEHVLMIPGGYMFKFDSSGQRYVYMNMSELIEFDKKNNVVWEWKANDYMSDIDIFPKGVKMESEEVRQEPHLNGFCTDAKNEYVYASFKNISRIVKIDKKTGKVVYSWGSKLSSGEAVDGNGFFHQQHAPAITKDGNVVLFDNDDMGVEAPSSIKMFTQPPPGKRSEVVWKFDCAFDSIKSHNKSVRGGNVDPLANNNFLVSMGGVNRVFEITPDKKVVWQAMVERNTHNDSGWIRLPLYRVHYASSLFPCYFSIEIDKDTIDKKHPSFTVKIFNDGTDADSYSIAVNSGKKNYKVEKNSGIVQGRRSTILTFSPTTKFVAGEQIEVSVKSDNNADFERKAMLVCK